MIELAIFDLAGTTVADNSEVHQALIDAFRSEEIDITFEEANAAMGIAKPIAIQQILEKHKVLTESQQDDLVDRIHNQFVQNVNSYYRTSDQVTEQQGTTELFQWLKKRGVKVGLDTGFDRATTDALLTRLDWLKHDLIDISVCSDEVTQGRPHPDMILKAMELTGIDSAEKIMKVGDTPVDLLEGDNAGCKYVIGVLNGTHSRDQLEIYPHTHLVRDLSEIPAILEPSVVRG